MNPSEQGLARLSHSDLFIMAGYAAAILFIGLRASAKRKTGSEDYILASRTLTLPTFIATLVTSFYGGTLGVGEYTYRYGLSNWVTQGLPYYCFALLYAMFLAGRIRARRGLTIPDHLESIYGKATAVLAGFLVFLLASPADEALMLGILAQWSTGWPLWLCVTGMTALSVCFLFAGGLRSEAWTGMLEMIFMYAGFAIILPFAWLAVGHGDALKAALPATHLTPSGGNPPLYVLTWFFIALWTFVDPSFHQRVCAAKDARTARIGIAVSVGFWFLFDLMTTSTGLMARALLPDLKDPLTAFPELSARLLPPVLRGLFLAGVASSILASLGATSFLAAVSLAKDCLGRLKGIQSHDEERWIRMGLVATSILAVILALSLRSVVGLWYTMGSTVIPGLLVVLISSYFEKLRIPPLAAFLCSLTGWLGAVIAWAFGWSAPFYAGLGCSVAVWTAGRVRRAWF